MQQDKSSIAVKAALELIRQKQADNVVRLGLLAGGDIELEINKDSLVSVALFLRDDPLLDFKYFSFMFANDKVDYLEVVYILDSLVKGMRVQLKAKLDPHGAKVDSLAAVFPGANWHERETYDMFGIDFAGHPYHHRMFLDEDFVGHPMLKSYKLAGRAE